MKDFWCFFTHRRFYTPKLFHTEAFPASVPKALPKQSDGLWCFFPRKRFYTQKLLHTKVFYAQTLFHTGHTQAFRQTRLHAEVFTHRSFYTQSFYTQNLLHTDAFTHRRFYTQTLLHTEAFTHRLLHTDSFTHKRFYTQNLLHTEAFYAQTLYTQTLLHTEPFAHRSFYTPKLLHTEAFTHRRFYTQALLHTEAFTHRPKSLNRKARAMGRRACRRHLNMIKGLISADAADGKGERVRKDITISQGQERSKLQEPERGKQTKEESKEQTSKAEAKEIRKTKAKPTDSKPASFKSKRQGRKHQVQEQSQFPKHVASTSSMPKPKRCGRGGNILLSNLSYVWEMLFGASS